MKILLVQRKRVSESNLVTHSLQNIVVTNFPLFWNNRSKILLITEKQCDLNGDKIGDTK